ncbi:putative ATP-dependent RNA helicase TDRD12 isoform X3 [Callithrix jacchus]
MERVASGRRGPRGPRGHLGARNAGHLPWGPEALNAEGKNADVAGAWRGRTQPASPAVAWDLQGEGACLPSGARRMLQLLMLKIEDPGCFWVIIKGCSPFLDHDVDYQKLHSAMNDFYNSMCQDIEIKPLILEEGQVCVVYCEELKCWCRAIVKSIVSSADQYLAECFLVDFAKNIPVKSKKPSFSLVAQAGVQWCSLGSLQPPSPSIRVAVESFMQLPYRAKKFSLYCTRPVTLHIDFCEDSTDIIPARKWDSAAVQYFQNLLKATTQVEARLCAVEEDTFEVYLYVTIKDEKVCVNDDLVAKNYACYMSPTKNKNLDYLEKPRLDIKSAPSSNKLNPALTLWPMFLREKDVQRTENSHGLNFLAQSLQHTWCKGVVGDLRPTATALDEAVKCNMDSLRDAPKNKSEKNQHCISLKDTNKRVESSAYWPTKRGITIYADPVIPEASDLSQKPNEKPLRSAEKKEFDEKNGCVKLLQFLNPDPLRADGISDLQQLQKLKSGLQPPVAVLRNKVEPCLTIESSPLSAELKKALQRNKFPGPSHTESYSWPPIARGCDVVVISHCESDPLVYLPPVLTILQTGACYKSLPSRNGPLAVIVCPGWKKAQFIFELLGEYSMSSRPLHPVLLTIGLHKEEAKKTKLPRGCDVIVTTPHSLLRLLTSQSLLFLRLCHLVLDEVEVLFLEASEQMFAILDNFKKNIDVEERESAPHQIVAVGVHWNKHIEHLIKEFMNDPYIVITAMEEAALYGNVQQVVHLCLECEKTSTLLQALDFIPSQPQKTLIFTCSVAETEIVCKVVESSSIFCLKMHKEVVFNLQNVLEQWKKKLSSGSHTILALTDDCVPLLAITDATCVVHFSFPASPKVFGGRLYCMSDHFHTEQGSPAEQGDKKGKSVLLLTEKDASHAVGILRYLERADAKVPAELYEFTAGVLEAKEVKKATRPLCPYLKAFGFCKDKRICPDRHRINPEIDMPRKLSSQALPSFGYIKIIPFYILNATNYFGRVIDKHMDLYATLSAEMNEYFKDSSNKTTVEKVEKFGLYGVAEKTLFHRVQVLEVSQKEDAWALDEVLVEFIDEGRTRLITRDQLLHLPEHFHALPPQAVEFIVCRVKPADNEMEWNPKVTRYIHHKIVGKLHDAKVILALGNTIWIDPMVHITNLSNLKTSVIDYNVRAEILSMGMGIDNPEHAEQLKKLREGAKIPAFEESLSQTPLTVTGTRPAQDQDCPSKQQEGHRTPPAAEDAACLQSLQAEDLGAEGGAESKMSSENQKPETSSGNTEGASVSRTAQPPLKSFHPQVKWFQKEDVIVLKIRIRNAKDYKCQYLRDRVVFSAWVGDKFYLADLELRGNIRQDDCTCVIRNDEPLITLAKERREAWCHLLRHRNPNVAFDFDHWEDSEEDSYFPKEVNRKNLPYTAAEEAEDSSSTSEDDDSESE